MADTTWLLTAAGALLRLRLKALSRYFYRSSRKESTTGSPLPKAVARQPEYAWVDDCT